VDKGAAEVILITFPPSVSGLSHKKRKNWLSQYIGHIPPDHGGSGPWPLKSIYYADAVKLDAEGKIKLAGAPRAPAAVTPPKPDAKKENEELPIIISSDAKKRTGNIFSPMILGEVDQAGLYIADPNKIEHDLGKRSSFMQQMGWPTKAMLEKGYKGDLHFFDGWRRGHWQQLGLIDLEALITVLMDFQLGWWKDNKAVLEAAKIGKKAA
jgi:hypothetical protein